MEKSQIYIRFNTQNDNNNPLPWRVLVEQDCVDGVLQFKQLFASVVHFNAPAVTSCDQVEPGVVKWHLRGAGYLAWQGDVCTVLAHPPGNSHG